MAANWSFGNKTTSTDLFSSEDVPHALDVAIDSNIFLDLVDDRSDETDGLVADWLQPLVSLCFTAELLNEINRSDNPEIRKTRRAQAQRFKLLECTLSAFNAANQLLKPLFPTLTTPQDESDFRHLVRAVACDADAFVTRDEALLDRSEDVFNACGLPVVRPAEFIGRLDTIEREREYQRQFVAGTRQIIQNRLSLVDDKFVEPLLAQDESQRKLVSQFSTYLANPQQFECQRISDRGGSTLAVFVLEHVEEVVRIPLLRIPAKRQSGSLARAILTGLIRQAATKGVNAVLVTDTALSDVTTTACADLGFLAVSDGQLKLVHSGWTPAEELSKAIRSPYPRIEELRKSFKYAKDDAVIASKLEHAVWPAKIADAVIPCFIVPIRPAFAKDLFDGRLAAGSLFGADPDSVLNPESAFYRSARNSIVRSPARVLWYVSKNSRYRGAMSIRACSRIVEIVIDKPKRLYSRFRRLGVYEWSDVFEAAKHDLEKNVMAFRFDDTELLNPVPWKMFQSILKANGINTNLESPIEIPASVFGEIYASAIHSSEVRKPDSLGGEAS